MALSLLAGCAKELPQHHAMVHVGSVQPAPALDIAPASPCARPVGEMPIHRVGDQAFVTLSINGQNLNLLLDSGDFVTSLTPDAAARLALPPSDQPGVQMTGIGGSYVAPVVDAADVIFLGQHISHVPFPVLPGTEFDPSEHIDGLFGANFLSAYEVEMDFPAGKMRFFHRYAGCSTSGPAWTAQATHLPATDAGHQLLLVPVSVNGVELNALIDTGSEDTSITRDAAASLGLTAASMRGDEQITENGLGQSTERMHRFDSIQIGSAVFAHPTLAVDDQASPLQANVEMQTAAALPVPHHGVDVILGANFLFKKRIFVAYDRGEVLIDR